ncbi:Molybdenum cofactor sulfurase [Pseudoneurospora amorphoporcata]|uniref:Molybdenum cofactor sulfurase n=1 Tax=Pseudoneurospora amorphoporcata TaxID=241081 RepID=A0AAN6SDB4_9PEZI|nr:Molybdenum cofactor sulfurase [Pseudoneurospora amorphoporcata]
MGSLYTDSEGYNADVERIREEEYPMLKDSLYLDHAGTTPYPKSLMDRFAHEMTTNLFGNPHSASASSQLSTQRIQDIRLRALQFFNADPADFDLVFVANATAGIKLVTDAMRCLPTGFDYAYHQASHTSLVGVREEATSSVCLHDRQMEDWLAGDCPFKEEEEEEEEERPILFAYPAQSNMDGRRFPLSWSSQVRQTQETKITRKTYTLLDAAALVSSSPLDLSNAQTAPDFVVLSFYKIFGFPDLGALIVRKESQHVFSSRRYFGGGTVDMVVCLKEQWHAPKDGFLHERLEDGTLPIHSIIALDVAMDVHARLFGTMKEVAGHTGFLARRLYWALKGLRHANGEEVCALYSPDPDSPQKEESGPVVAFNIRNAQGTWISLAEVEKLAMLKGIHIRTGGVCNPGGIASALGLAPWEMKQNFSSGFRCGTDNDIMGGKPTGIIRASLGAMSTVADVDRFVGFVDEFYREDTSPLSLPVSSSPDCSDSKLQPPPLQNIPQLFVKSIIVYPIKSCAGFPVPPGIDWEVRPEGLAWDREWCLVHRGSGQALSQKRYPKMALLRPNLDFTRGELQVSYAGDIPPSAAAGLPSSISVPLSKNPKMFVPTTRPGSGMAMSSRVCGEEITAQSYASAQINDFFSTVLGVPCVLARFPPGGQGKGMTRHAKAHLQRHQQQASQPQSQPRPAVSASAKPKKPSKQPAMMPGAFPSSAETEVGVGAVETPPSPPDSDTEQQRSRSRSATRICTEEESQGQGPKPRRILLSNESPILAITTTSVDALNESIAALNPPSSAKAKGPVSVSDAVFRANLILAPMSSTISFPMSSTTSSTTSELNPYEEDTWSFIHILNSSSCSSSSAGNKFQMLGSCRRCHMVCIDQSTGEKSSGGEPFVTLTKTRRFEGKVFFGVHMGLAEEEGEGEGEGEGEEGDVGSGRRRVVRVRVGDVVIPRV